MINVSLELHYNVTFQSFSNIWMHGVSTFKKRDVLVLGEHGMTFL